ncbi:hypothetical protein GCM10009675_39070 [Prauserella alba]|uniref:DUF3558 domain-containing protein n=2 Tax=Prauserella alba TaxID=176898 RepID=A0ABP4G4G1_9PSEU
MLLVAGCGASEGGAETASTSKRLPNGDACSLLPKKEANRILETNNTETTPADYQCDFSSQTGFDSFNVIRGQDMSKMETGESVNISGVEGGRLEATDSGCGVSVKLDSDDPKQQFAVVSIVNPGGDLQKDACAVADEAAKSIINNLPE